MTPDRRQRLTDIADQESPVPDPADDNPWSPTWRHGKVFDDLAAQAAASHDAKLAAQEDEG